MLLSERATHVAPSIKQRRLPPKTRRRMGWRAEGAEVDDHGHKQIFKTRRVVVHACLLAEGRVIPRFSSAAPPNDPVTGHDHHVHRRTRRAAFLQDVSLRLNRRELFFAQLFPVDPPFVVAT